MRLLFSLLFVFLFFKSNGQNDISEQVAKTVQEGKSLYRLEMSSWFATDIFLQLGDRDKCGGYFSYLAGDKTKCVFYSKEDTPKVIAEVTLDSSYKTANMQTSLAERSLTPEENILFKLRTAAEKQVTTDDFFKHYDGTRLNLIPVIDSGKRKVYVLTGPQNDGQVIFGNDYLLTFDNDNKLIDKERFHNSMIPFAYKEHKDALAGMHTHVAGRSKIITPTDICTLMLYEKYTPWKQYFVISGDYVSIWDCEKNEVSIMTTDEWKNKMQKEQK